MFKTPAWPGEKTMNSTRDHFSKYLVRSLAGAALLAGGILPASNALAEQVSIQFSQTFPGGGTVTGLLVGEDLDGDGRLYSVAPPLAEFIGIEGGGEEIYYASVRIEGVLGQTVTNVFDASVADINDPSNFFWGFAHNLDGGQIGDDPDEGLAFAPLAPSTSYVVGPLFSPAFGTDFFNTDLIGCGTEGGACGGIATLDPVDPFPNFELLFAATSDALVETNDLLRYTFEQGGFDGGASVTGTVSGRDLDGDGRLYSVGQAYIDFLGYPAGDEIAYASVTIRGMGPEAIVNTVDLVGSDVLDPLNFFFGAAVNVAGSQLGDEDGEGISIAPFSPSTSYIVGELFAPGNLGTQPIANCGNAEGLPCGALTTQTPNPDSPTGVDLQAEQNSAEPIALTPAPLVINGDFSGHFLNPVPSGEGVIVQVIANGTVLVYWLTYDDDGSQRWLLGIGERQGLSVEIDELYETDNGMMATMDPVIIDLDMVGRAVIDFSGCNDATLEAIVDGVPRTMELGRLTGLDSLECVQ
jgi:hypothetical protein